MKRIINITICFLLLSLSGCIFINPTTLDFGSDGTSKTFTLTVIGNVEWSITPIESWITVEPDSGQGTATINVTVDRTGLDDNTYEAILNISTNPNVPCPDVIVKMTVGNVTTSTTTSIIDGSTTTTSSPTTTTTTSGGEPDVTYLIDFVDYENNSSGVCIGGEAWVTFTNQGEAGLVYAKANLENRCTIFHMNKDESSQKRFYFSVCPTNLYFEARAAHSDDYGNCKNPPKVSIDSPPNNSIYILGDTITFSGEALDTKDGTLTGSSLVWTSDKDGQIGTGESFSKNDLSSGDHNITLSTTNSNGDEESDSVWLFIDYQDRKVWEHEGTSPTLSNGNVYLVSGEKVYCLDAQTGNKVWEFDTVWMDVDFPLVSYGYVYVGGRYLYCLDAQNGEQIWSYTWYDKGPIAASDGYIYFLTQPFGLIRLGATGGSIVEYDFSHWDVVPTCPVVSEEYLYIGDEKRLYCFNALTGDKKWMFESTEHHSLPYGVDLYSSPAVTNGYVYVGMTDYKVYCLDSKTGEELWNFPTGGIVTSSPAISGGYVYVGSADNKVYCLNAQTGYKVWDFSTRGDVHSSPAVSGGYVYVGSRDRNVYCLDSNTGKIIWVFATEGWVDSSPVVSGGYVYVGSYGKVYCLKAAEGDTGSWPVFKYNPARTGAK